MTQERQAQRQAQGQGEEDEEDTEFHADEGAGGVVLGRGTARRRLPRPNRIWERRISDRRRIRKEGAGAGRTCNSLRWRTMEDGIEESERGVCG